MSRRKYWVGWVVLLVLMSITTMAIAGAFQEGFIEGKLSKAQILNNIEIMKSTIASRDISYRKLLSYAKQEETFYRTALPDKISWMKGVSKATGVSFNDLLIFNTQYKKIFNVGGECTTFIAQGKATKNNITIIAKNRDLSTHTLCEIHIRNGGAAPSIYKAAYIDIPNVEHTYKFIGSKTAGRWGYGMGINENQVLVADNDAPSRDMLQFKEGLHDNDVVRLVLERAKSARNAVDVIASLVSKYGQAWNGIIFEVGDPNEVWIVAVTGKRWVAKRYKDTVTARANEYEISDDYDLAAPDLISYAIKQGWVKKGTKKINFREVYSADVCYPSDNSPRNQHYPVYESKIRYRRAMQLLKKDFGHITVSDTMRYVRDHFDKVVLPSGKVLNIKQTPHYSSGYAKILPFESINKKPKHDYYKMPLFVRSISMFGIRIRTATTAIMVARPNMPSEVGAVMWHSFSVPSIGVFVPFYLGINRVPKFYETPMASTEFDTISSMVFGNYTSLFKDIRAVYDPFEKREVSLSKIIDNTAINLIKEGKKEEAINLLTEFSYSNAIEALFLAKKVHKLIIQKYAAAHAWSR